jgi:hypothetical protein
MASETSLSENVHLIKRKSVYIMAGTQFIISSNRLFLGSVTLCKLRKPGIPARNSSSLLSSSNKLSVQDRPQMSISEKSLKMIFSVSLIDLQENYLLYWYSMMEILYQLSKLTSLHPCNFEAIVLKVCTIMTQQIPVVQNQATWSSWCLERLQLCWPAQIRVALLC